MSDIVNFLGKIDIVESVYAPKPTLKRYPRKGPYFQKRLKRIQANPKNWTEPEFFIGDGFVIAHPSVVHLVRQLL